MTTVTFDCETHNSGLEYSMPPEEFVRLFQYQVEDGPVQFSTDLEEMRTILREADCVVGHNIISADLGWIFGPDSLEPLQMAREQRVVDTFVIGSLITPAPNKYTDALGHTYYDADSPGAAMKWLSLSNLCYQFGLPGKLGDLSKIAERYNPPGTAKRNLQYGLIALDDPEFLAYAEQDVVAGRALYLFHRDQIAELGYSREYLWRELELASATEQMSRNGILVDQEWARNRIEELAVERDRLMSWLVSEYDFPTSGKSPWATSKGKEVILRVLADHEVTPENYPDWPRTPTGALKLGGDDLIDLAEGTDAEDFAQALATLKGQRSIPQQVLDNTQPDGRVHPHITSLQRSGRWSFTNPAVTIFGSRGGRDIDKSIFIAETGKVLAGFDFSNADPRAMAALSGDVVFALPFLELDPETGKPYDGHNLRGVAMFGEEDYYIRFTPEGKSVFRDVAKAGANALNYNIGPKKLASLLNAILKKQKIDRAPFTLAETKAMIESFNREYVMLKQFKDRAAHEGEKEGQITNAWGRIMIVPREKAWTVAPALYGQNSVRELMGDAILRLIDRGEYYTRALRAIIHDELLMEFNEATIEEDIRVVRECMEVPFDPKTFMSLEVPFPVGVGYGKNWKDAGH